MDAVVDLTDTFQVGLLVDGAVEEQRIDPLLPFFQFILSQGHVRVALGIVSGHGLVVAVGGLLQAVQARRVEGELLEKAPKLCLSPFPFQVDLASPLLTQVVAVLLTCAPS